MRPARPTLAQAFVGSFLLLAVVPAALLGAFYVLSRRALLVATQRVMAESSARVVEAISDHLAEAERAVASFEEKAREGLIDFDDAQGVARAATIELAGRPLLTHITVTHARIRGWYDGDREHDAGDPVVERTTHGADGRWQVTARRDGHGVAVEALESHASADPTTHDTFITPANREQRGHLLWSDLWRADGPRVVTVQKALWAHDQHAVAVLRVTIVGERIDALVQSLTLPGHTVFVCDAQGRLVSRLQSDDALYDVDDGVRVRPVAPAPAVVAALASSVWDDPRSVSAPQSLPGAGEPQLLFVAAFPDDRTQGWRVGIVAPERLYLGDLQQRVRRLLGLAAALAALGLGVAGLIVRATRRDVQALVVETNRLRAFDFSPNRPCRFQFRDVAAAADSLGQAKTALRSLAKYAPVDLVRQLYDGRQEPQLGGHIQDVSLLFSDIEGFTTIAEGLPLDVLARALGLYFAVFARSVHHAGGIIDKYVGDGVMALWNAPVACSAHPVRACEAILTCLRDTERLFASDAWRGQGLPRWRTRFGLHRADASVGHFGAPDRMSFTAMGDGVNLAARLEGLNKQYGTQVLVSAAVERDARGTLDFRRLDRVAVKGKSEAVEVFELLGPQGSRTRAVERYEAALALYFETRFADAVARLDEGLLDPPAHVLRARCLRFLAAPPPPEWDGVFVANEK